MRYTIDKLTGEPRRPDEAPGATPASATSERDAQYARWRLHQSGIRPIHGAQQHLPPADSPYGMVSAGAVVSAQHGVTHESAVHASHAAADGYNRYITFSTT